MHKIAQGATLYFSLFSAPCRTVLLTAKYLNVDFPSGGMRKINVHDQYEHLNAWFEKINYEKVVPTLVDNGLVLWESRAIAKYLVLKYASKDKKELYPENIADQARVDRLLYFDQGVLYQSISDYFTPQAVCNECPNPVLGAGIERGLQLLEKVVLKGNHFVLGGSGGPDHLTIADISILGSLSQLDAMDYSYEKYQAISQYVEFLKDHLTIYRECCQEGVGLTRDWARRNLKYLPRYLNRPNIPYDDKNLDEHRI